MMANTDNTNKKHEAMALEKYALERAANRAVWRLNLVHGYLDAAVLNGRDVDTNQAYGMMHALGDIINDLAAAVDMPSPVKESL